MSIRRTVVKLDQSKRVIKYQGPSPAYKRMMERIATHILVYCDDTWSGEASGIDTAVRDVLADGIARLLHVAYDCQACALNLHDEANWGFIESSVSGWFRSRGFAEWYCQGAATLFNTSRPRILEDRVIGAPKMRTRAYSLARRKRKRAGKKGTVPQG
jgi:hypothetical protein